MSTHDRGAFGALLAEAKALGCDGIEFYIDFALADEDENRWYCEVYGGRAAKGRGRTGEEALRRLVERLRT